MAIPIKAQLHLGNYADNWKNITMLTDGSMYMVDVAFMVHPVDRSYAGQAIKDHMKRIATDYHRHMFFASSAKKMGDLINADFYRGTAECIDVEYKKVKKFWQTFKNMSPRKNKVVKNAKCGVSNSTNSSVSYHYYVTNTNDVMPGWISKLNL